MEKSQLKIPLLMKNQQTQLKEKEKLKPKLVLMPLLTSVSITMLLQQLSLDCLFLSSFLWSSLLLVVALFMLIKALVWLFAAAARIPP